MAHQHDSHISPDSSHLQGSGPSGSGPSGSGGEDLLDSILDTVDAGKQTQLLEMLHVPLLHGGVQEVLLLTSFTTTTAASFALACCLLGLCAALLEMLRLLTWWLESRYTSDGQSAPRQGSCACKHCTSLTIAVTGEGERKHYDAIHDDRCSRPASTTPLTSPASQHSSHTRHIYWVSVGFLHFLIYVIATLLMLIAMTMNIYLIISMGAGAATGKMITTCVRRRLACT